MAQTRRSFLSSFLALLLAWTPGRVWSQPPAARRKEADTLAQAMDRETGGRQPLASGQITLTVPDIAEDGALVPVTVESTLPGAESIWIFVEKNPAPLAARFKFGQSLDPFVSLRIKMNESCAVVALVKAGGEYFSTSKRVKVVLGGCG